jgi:DNA-directed RNA polymerase specialized sigma24 family protein
MTPTEKPAPDSTIRAVRRGYKSRHQLEAFDGREGCGPMATTGPWSEADLESALRDNREVGIQLLVAEFGEPVLRYIKHVTRGLLDPQELMVVYQETILGVIETVRRPGFDPCRPLRVVYRIARNKGIDALRRRGLRAATNEGAFLGNLPAGLKDADLGSRAKLGLSPAEAREFRQVLLEFVATLPPRQRLVAQCFVDNCDAFSERDIYMPLADAVSAVTGQTESVAAVKSDWRFAREKIAAELRRRGYTFLSLE